MEPSYIMLQAREQGVKYFHMRLEYVCSFEHFVTMRARNSRRFAALELLMPLQRLRVLVGLEARDTGEALDIPLGHGYALSSEGRATGKCK